MPAPALTHVAFHTPDMDRILAFYQEYAGMPLLRDRMDGDVRVTWLGAAQEDSSFMFVFIQGLVDAPNPPPTVDHVGFECESRAEVDAIAARARAAGVPIVQGPVEWPPPVGYFVILADPDGNHAEFAFPTS